MIQNIIPVLYDSRVPLPKDTVQYKHILKDIEHISTSPQVYSLLKQGGGFPQEGSSQLNIEEFWNEAQPIAPYSSVKELSGYHTFYMICLHGWRHQLNSIKYFFDILQVAHVLGSRMDYERLWKDASTHKTLNRVQNTLSIVYSQFPQLCPIPNFSLKMNHSRWWKYEAIRHSDYRTYK